jgi:uncharacterized lipoprotein YbaY
MRNVGTSIGVMIMSVLLSGEIDFAEPPALPPKATIYVRLLDTSMADAPAVLIAEQVLRGSVEEANRTGKVRFQLQGETISTSRQYTVGVLVDVDGDGRVGPGDFINTQSYPVLTAGYPREISIQVTRVR